MNRLHHLKQTLKKNILDNIDFPNFEVVLLDYNSQDGLENWIRTEMMDYIEKGILVYYRTSEPSEFQMAHSKNMVTKLSNFPIIALVDADNFTGPNYLSHVINQFENIENIFLTTIEDSNANLTNDVLGRVCFRRTDFDTIEGFDEYMNKYGFDDFDFAYRLEKIGLKRIPINSELYLNYISHSNEDRLSNSNESTNQSRIYVQHISPDESNLMFINNASKIKYGTIVNNRTVGSNNLELLSTRVSPKYNYTLKQDDWIECSVANELDIVYVHDKKNPLTIFRDNGCYTSSNAPYNKFQLLSDSLTEELTMFFCAVRNRNKMENNLLNKKAAVNNGNYGQGTAYRNFNLNEKIVI